MEKQGPAVVEKAVAAALARDLSACRLILDRICPPLRAVDSPVSIPVATDGDALADVSSRRHFGH